MVQREERGVRNGHATQKEEIQRCNLSRPLPLHGASAARQSVVPLPELIMCQVAGFTVVSALALWSYARQGEASHAGVGGGTATGSALTLNSCVHVVLSSSRL